MLKNKRLESQIIAKSLVAKKTLQKPKGLSMITFVRLMSARVEIYLIQYYITMFVSKKSLKIPKG
jgi:hypothetical protein